MTTPQHRPATVEECYRWLLTRLSEKQLADLASLTRSEVWQCHYWLCPIIRAEVLADNAALLERFDNTAFCGDPDIAYHIAEGFWDHPQIHGIP